MDIRVHKHVVIRLDCSLVDVELIRSALYLFNNSDAAKALVKKIDTALQENELD